MRGLWQTGSGAGADRTAVGRSASEEAPPKTHRDDLQGLRAVAVLLVALGHAGVGFLKGGFVGVDVFFVLSGFLITGVLLSAAAKHGRVAFGNFYVRRIRRILPAATLTLVATDVAAYYLLNYVRAKQAVNDSLYASAFAANIHFARLNTDYFARGQPPSAIQHFWSLAVEEQFYVVWPALLAVVLFGLTGLILQRSRRVRGRVTIRSARRLLLAVVILGGLSLAWSIRYTGTTPTAAYFSTLARSWELALGAALAIAVTTLDGERVAPRALARFQPTAGIAGLVGIMAILVSAVGFSSTTPFPGAAALLPTVGAALVIASGVTGRPTRIGSLLALRPLRYIGDRSYAFYLWHWPVLIIAGEYAGHSLSLPVQLMLLVGAFGLSIISYATVENPLRRTDWSPSTTTALGVAAVAASVLVAAVVYDREVTKAQQLEAAPIVPALKTVPIRNVRSEHGARASLTVGTLPVVITAVRAANRHAPIPSRLTPPVSALLNDIYYLPEGCTPGSDNQTTSDICRLGTPSSARTIVLIGDSHAEMWMPAILSLADRDGWAVVPFTKSGCTPVKWTHTSFGTRPCQTWFRWALEHARALHPRVTLVTGYYANPVGEYADAVKQAFLTVVDQMRGHSGDVMIVGDDDGLATDPVDCLLSRQATMRRCTTTRGVEDFALDDDLATLARDSRFRFLDTRGWFCWRRQCPTVIGQTIAYRDTGHLTKTYATELAPSFTAAFRTLSGQPRGKP